MGGNNYVACFCGPDGPTKTTIHEGDLVIMYQGFGTMTPVWVTKGDILNNKGAPALWKAWRTNVFQRPNLAIVNTGIGENSHAIVAGQDLNRAVYPTQLNGNLNAKAPENCPLAWNFLSEPRKSSAQVFERRGRGQLAARRPGEVYQKSLGGYQSGYQV